MKYVDSWFIKQWDNGLIQLYINCTQKEIYYDMFNTWEFLKFNISGTEEEFDGWSSKCILEIDYSMSTTDTDYYMYLGDVKDDWQIVFSWMKLNRPFLNQSEIVLSSKKQ